MTCDHLDIASRDRRGASFRRNRPHPSHDEVRSRDYGGVTSTRVLGSTSSRVRMVGSIASPREICSIAIFAWSRAAWTDWAAAMAGQRMGRSRRVVDHHAPVILVHRKVRRTVGSPM